MQGLVKKIKLKLAKIHVFAGTPNNVETISPSFEAVIVVV